MAVHLVDVLLAPDIPDLDHLVGADGDRVASIVGGLNRVDITLMTLQVGDIDTLLCIPNLDIIFHQATRKQDSRIQWVEAHSPNDSFVALELHLENVFLLAIIFFKVRCDDDLDHLVITSGGDQSASPTPIDTINTAIVMVKLLEHHLNTLALITASLIILILLVNTKWLQDTRSNLAELETLRVST